MFFRSLSIIKFELFGACLKCPRLCLSVFLCCRLRTAKMRIPELNQSQKTSTSATTTAVMGSPMQEGKQDLDSVPGAMYATSGSNDAVAVGYPINEEA